MTTIALLAFQAAMSGQVQPHVAAPHVDSTAMHSSSFKPQQNNSVTIPMTDIQSSQSPKNTEHQMNTMNPTGRLVSPTIGTSMANDSDNSTQGVCEGNSIESDKDKTTQKQHTHATAINRWLVAIAIAAIGGGCAIYQHLYNTKGNSNSRIPETSVAYAARNLENLFKSAQQTFIHRNGRRMGASIDELGEHFTIGSNGTIIYREIWYARYGRPESDITPFSQQDDWERKALADPYRYAVLPVHDFESPELDDRTSVLVAVPVSGSSIPGLLIVAGPVRNDPADFLRRWPIKRIVTPEGCQLLRERIDAKKPYDPAFAKELSSHFEEEF